MSQRNLTDFDRVISDIRSLSDRPRVQQKTWVAQSKDWLPVLQNVRAELSGENDQFRHAADANQAIWSVLKGLGLVVAPRNRTSWGFSWHGAELQGDYGSPAEALEGALRQRLPA